MNNRFFTVTAIVLGGARLQPVGDGAGHGTNAGTQEKSRRYPPSSDA
jgi:hypothetical protein